jgi:hypothetical protein
MCLAKKQKVPIVFGLIRPGLQTLFYHTLSHLTNHYTTDVNFVAKRLKDGIMKRYARNYFQKLSLHEHFE